MKTYREIQKIVSDCDCSTMGRGMTIKLGTHEGTDRLYLQVGSERECAYTGKEGTGWGGKAEVSLHSTTDEIVKKVFGLCLAYVEHETREGFHYKDRKIFNPHTTVEALYEACEHRASREKPVYSATRIDITEHIHRLEKGEEMGKVHLHSEQEDHYKRFAKSWRIEEVKIDDYLMGQSVGLSPLRIRDIHANTVPNNCRVYGNRVSCGRIVYEQLQKKWYLDLNY